MSRVNSKARYILQLLTLFRKKGLDLTMEEIAKGMKLTKKTLYNNFNSKEELLKEVLTFVISDLETQMDEALGKGKDAIEALCMTSKMLSMGLDKLGSKLISDSAIYMPELTMLDLRGGINFNTRMITENLNRGIREGLYREDINKDLAAIFFTASMSQLYFYNGSYMHFKEASKFHKELIRYHLEAVVNDNGREILRKYLKNNYICDSNFK
jgi:AcrR family transcriptional regulator